MEDSFNQLLTIMWEQIKVFNMFKELGESKTPALVKGRYEDLERIIKAEELLVVEMGHLERQRQDRSREIARTLGMAAEEMSISSLQTVFSEHAEELEEIKSIFTATSRELGELNQLNNELIEQSLRHLDFTVQLLTETSGSPIYGHSGSVQVGGSLESSRLFDRWA